MAATEPAGSGTRPIAPAAPRTDDWPVQATDSIVKFVDGVRDKTTGPAITATRVLVYGTAIFLLVGPLLVLALVGTMRAVEHALNRGVWEIPGLAHPMWIVYLFFGGVFTLAGVWCWRKAGKPAPEPR